MKKMFFVVLILFISLTVWGYQGDKAIGLNLEINADKSEAAGVVDQVNSISVGLMYSMMRNETFELAPYIRLRMDSDKTDDVWNNGLTGFTFGAKLNYHFIKTNVLSLALGGDPRLYFSNRPDDVNPNYSYFSLSVGLPVTMDVNFTENFILRLEYSVGSVGFYKQDLGGGIENSGVWAYTVDAGLDPLQFGFMYSF